MRLRSGRALIGVLTLATWGCGSGTPSPRQTPIRVEVVSVRDAIIHYNAQCPTTQRLRAQATIEYRSGEVKKSFDAAIYLETLDRKVRLRGDAYFVTIFDMTFSEGNFAVFVPSRRTLYRGAGDSFHGFALQDLTDALSPLPLPDEVGSVLIEEDPLLIMLTEVSGGEGGGELHPTQKIYLARNDFSLVRRMLYYPTGVVKSDIHYSKPVEFKSGRFPSRVVVRRPWQNIMVTLNVQKLEAPKEFKPDLFTLATPQGTKSVDLKPDVSEDIIFEAGDGNDN